MGGPNSGCSRSNNNDDHDSHSNNNNNIKNSDDNDNNINNSDDHNSHSNISSGSGFLYQLRSWPLTLGDGIRCCWWVLDVDDVINSLLFAVRVANDKMPAILRLISGNMFVQGLTRLGWVAKWDPISERL